MFSVPSFLACMVKTSVKFVRILEQMKTSTASDLLLNFPKLSPRFSPDYEGNENKLYFVNNRVIESDYTQS